MSGSEENGRRHFMKLAAAGLAVGAVACSGTGQKGIPPKQGKNVAALVTPALDVVRFGLVGLGDRGDMLLDMLLLLDGIQINAVCDVHQPAIEQAQKKIAEAGRPAPAVYSKGEFDYQNLIKRDDIDVVLVATPWDWHASMAIDSMEAGKHVLVEVPLALTVEDLWRVVDTAERTQLHCMMMENVCYGRDEMMALNMCRQGLFGELLHGEGAYIHELRWQMHHMDWGTGSWRTDQHARRNGNLYPTHGLGPISQYMKINAGDKFSHMVSMGSPALGRDTYAAREFPEGNPRTQKHYQCADINTSIIKTELGRTILLQYDTTTPRPYTRLNHIQGTKGMFASYPSRIAIEGRGDFHHWQELEPFREEFEHPLWRNIGSLAKGAGDRHGGMDFLMLWRAVYCLRNEEPMDQSVYDGASWSAPSPLSELSIKMGSSPVNFPDFTRGAWKTTKPLGIVNA